MKHFGIRLFALAVALLGLVAPAFAQASEHPAAIRTDASTLTYRRIFKSSYPEFVEINVNEGGAGTYDIRQLDDTASPQPMQIGQPLVQKMFELADELHDFQGVDLDVHRRIANLGQKTFIYKKGSATHEVTFNYTLNNTAQQLLVIFDGLQRQELDLSDMERVMRYDHLGIADVITRVQSDVKNKLIPEPDALLPALDQIAQDSELMDMSRQRARALAQQIREKS
ncbi:MAG TPA: hypothetical protein VGS59_00790 [Candidatus Acidoferrales bacterium]|nr:hypothetical protein [Candidatus Acidoferrales bacterium]